MGQVSVFKDHIVKVPFKGSGVVSYAKESKEGRDSKWPAVLSDIWRHIWCILILPQIVLKISLLGSFGRCCTLFRTGTELCWSLVWNGLVGWCYFFTLLEAHSEKI